jgi:mono/diheme cytochrome c family protein
MNARRALVATVASCLLGAASIASQGSAPSARPMGPAPVPAHVVPAHVVPAHVVPAHVVPAHVVPARVLASASQAPVRPARQAQASPADSPPVQAVPAHASPAQAVPAVRPLIDRYCVTCHSARLQTAGLTLEGLNPDGIRDGVGLETWEKVTRRLRAGTMPPLGVPRPEPPVYDQLAATLERELDAAGERHPWAGRSLVRRLNRSEYTNAIRDLLTLEIDAATLLPADDSSYGFDNIADVLGVSPALQERYLSAAAKISALAVGDPSRRAAAETYRVRQDLSQNQHIEGLPLGTIGGMVARHTFPLDGDYTLQVRLQHTNFGNLRGLDYPHQIEVTVDGARVHVATIGGPADLDLMFARPVEASAAIEARLAAKVNVKAGTRRVGVAFVRNLELGDTRRLQQFLRSSVDTLDWTGLPHIQSLTVAGPFGPTGPGETPSRQRLFVCRPATPDTELPCARRIVSTLARRAYRRPVVERDVRPLLELYQAGRADGTFESGIQRAVQAILSSPRFMFRIEENQTGPVPALELASRLSFFLWSSIPDDTLVSEAAAGRLSTPAQIERQVRRMLADPKAQALVSHFAGQWLQLRNVTSILPNSDEFPDFDDNLRQSMRRETELLFESVIREDRSVLDLLRADYTFLNERLARHYGVPGVYGSHFRRVPVTADARRGLLGQGSILALTSHAERTSPVVRGKWVLENLLGTPPPPPPPDVPTLQDNAAGTQPKTLRQRMTQHRANPVCATCHKVMDPIGFALENFDAVGAWRTEEPGGPIDTSGELADGTRVDGVVALREAILRRPRNFVSTMTEKLLTYALGRGIDYRDQPAVRTVVRGAAAGDYHFSSLVLGIVNSRPFRTRMAAEADAVSTTAQASALPREPVGR